MELKNVFRLKLNKLPLFSALNSPAPMAKKPSSPSSEYQKGFGTFFSVGEAKLIEVSELDNLTVEDTDKSESYVLRK